MRIEWTSKGCAEPEIIERNIAHAKTLGLPYPKGTGRNRLGVIGGGPSVQDAIGELKAFDGDLWIVGSAFQWARQNDIHGVYFSIDPMPENIREIPGVTRAIISANLDPNVLDALIESGAYVSMFELVETPERLNHGVTTATAVHELAILLDYTEIIFYGCESSFVGQSHVYGNEAGEKLVYVQADGEEFLTRPDYLMQAEYLGMMIRRFPKIFKERSGGLLRALSKTADYDITAVSRALYDTLSFKEQPA